MATSQLIDRRLNGRHKSAQNRQRFIRRYKEQIKQAIAESIAGRSITVGMRERSIALTAVSVVVCYLADVGSTLLWIVGFCVVSIVLHALFRESEEIASEADFV